VWCQLLHDVKGESINVNLRSLTSDWEAEHSHDFSETWFQKNDQVNSDEQTTINKSGLKNEPNRAFTYSSQSYMSSYQQADRTSTTS
jgi:hypothetical protein